MSRPNILLIMTDDHGAWAMPRHGSGLARHLQAPNLAWLADTGTTLRQAYTPCPVCSPARASMWSGLMPSAHGLHDYIQESPSERVDHPGLQDRHLGHRLQAAGYHTAMSGKWHCGGGGHKRDGFDRWSSLATGTNAKFGPQPFYVDDEVINRHGYQAPFIVDDAIRFLRERPSDQPFFAYVGMTDTHTPLDHQAPQRLRHCYQHIDIEAPHDEEASPDHGVARNTKPSNDDVHREKLIDYLASVSAVDAQIGRLIDELDSQGVLTDTLIIYTADHGHMNGQHGLMCKGNATIPQNLLDDSVLVPCIWHGPGVAANATCDHPVTHCDLHATIAAAAGCTSWELPTASPGEDYTALLQDGDAAQWRSMTVAEYGNARMWRSSEWKFIQRFPGPNGHFGDELYHLTTDPRERHNVIAEHNEVAATLRAALEKWFATYERPEQSGRAIASLKPTTPVSPWLLDPATKKPLDAIA